MGDAGSVVNGAADSCFAVYCVVEERKKDEERKRKRKRHYPARGAGNRGGAVAWRSFRASDLEPRSRTDNLAGTEVNITHES